MLISTVMTDNTREVSVPSIVIPESTEAVIRASTFAIEEEPYRYVRAAAVPRAGVHLLVTQDEVEVTVVTHERNLHHVEVIDTNPDRWALIAIDCANPFYCVGFFARITSSLSTAGIDVLAVSTFSRDYVLVKDTERDVARRTLIEVGFRER